MPSPSENISLNRYIIHFNLLVVLTRLILVLLCLGTPLSKVEEYRVEVCIVLRKLERLDKDELTEDERADAEEVSD